MSIRINDYNYIPEYRFAAAKEAADSFAQTLAAASKENEKQTENVFHSQTIAGGNYPMTEAPDYSGWNKEDAYCDIIKRYNLLNMLTYSQASELGLDEAYNQMKTEINDLLYGGDPMKICKNADEIKELESDIPQRMNRKVYCEMYGITSETEYEKLFKQDIMSMYDADNFNTNIGNHSDAFEIFNTLSDFDLTDQKTNLIRTVSGMLRGDTAVRYSAMSMMDISDYLNYRHEFADRQYKYGNMSTGVYSNIMAWNNFVRELYTLG